MATQRPESKTSGGLRYVTTQIGAIH